MYINPKHLDYFQKHSTVNQKIDILAYCQDCRSPIREKDSYLMDDSHRFFCIACTRQKKEGDGDDKRNL